MKTFILFICGIAAMALMGAISEPLAPIVAQEVGELAIWAALTAPGLFMIYRALERMGLV